MMFNERSTRIRSEAVSQHLLYQEHRCSDHRWQGSAGKQPNGAYWHIIKALLEQGNAGWVAVFPIMLRPPPATAPATSMYLAESLMPSISDPR